jgi:hypothetical protein
MTKVKDAGSNTVNTRLFAGRSLLLPGIISAGLGLASCAEQPEVQCFAALSFYSPFAVRYDLVSGSGECANLKAEGVGLQTYVTNPTKNKTAGINSIAMKAQQFGLWVLNGESNRADPADAMSEVEPIVDDAHEPYASGKFTSKHPSNDICKVPTLEPARLVLPEIPEHQVEDDELGLMYTDEDSDPDVIPAQPAIDATYKWSNVEVWVTPGDVGTQWAADLEYTINGCTAKYKALAVNAYVECESDADCAEASPSSNYATLKCRDSNELAPIDPNKPTETSFKKLCVLPGKFPDLK